MAALCTGHCVALSFMNNESERHIQSFDKELGIRGQSDLGARF
jgi:hypothetical protein